VIEQPLRVWHVDPDATASAELGARPGPVHRLVARYQQEWRDLLDYEAHEAAARGEVPKETGSARLAFELGVILAGTNILAILHSDIAAIEEYMTPVGCTNPAAYQIRPICRKIESAHPTGPSALTTAYRSRFVGSPGLPPHGVQKLCHAVKSRDLQRDRVYKPYARLEGRFDVSCCPLPDVGPL
jgi:hypothetical protein